MPLPNKIPPQRWFCQVRSQNLRVPGTRGKYPFYLGPCILIDFEIFPSLFHHFQKIKTGLRLLSDKIKEIFNLLESKILDNLKDTQIST